MADEGFKTGLFSISHNQVLGVFSLPEEAPGATQKLVKCSKGVLSVWPSYMIMIAIAPR